MASSCRLAVSPRPGGPVAVPGGWRRARMKTSGVLVEHRSEDEDERVDPCLDSADVTRPPALASPSPPTFACQRLKLERFALSLACTTCQRDCTTPSSSYITTVQRHCAWYILVSIRQRCPTPPTKTRRTAVANLHKAVEPNILTCLKVCPQWSLKTLICPSETASSDFLYSP